jgi:hypothetical protein
LLRSLRCVWVAFLLLTSDLVVLSSLSTSGLFWRPLRNSGMNCWLLAAGQIRSDLTGPLFLGAFSFHQSLHRVATSRAVHLFPRTWGLFALFSQRFDEGFTVSSKLHQIWALGISLSRRQRSGVAKDRFHPPHDSLFVCASCKSVGELFLHTLHLVLTHLWWQRAETAVWPSGAFVCLPFCGSTC